MPALAILSAHYASGPQHTNIKSPQSTETPFDPAQQASRIYPYRKRELNNARIVTNRNKRGQDAGAEPDPSS